MKSYTFYTVTTVVDIGDGSTKPIISDNKFTGTMNLCRLVETIMVHSYPMMVSVVHCVVDLSKNNNHSYYGLPECWGECTVSTFKFALPMDIDINVDGIPLVLPTIVNGVRITKFSTESSTKNIHITKQTFSVE